MRYQDKGGSEQRQHKADNPFYNDKAPKGKKKRSSTSKIEKTRVRLLIASLGFCFIFAAVAFKLTLATVIAPLPPSKRQIAPQVPEIPKIDPRGIMSGNLTLPQIRRASILDRNGQVLAISLPVAQVYANPQELIDPVEITDKLMEIIPNLDRDKTIERLSSKKQFVYIARDITPAQELKINNLGIPGIYFETGERRHYPLGRIASHILGYVDIDDHGIAGVEKFFDDRLLSDHNPLKLSIDVHVQTAVQEELEAAKSTFQAIGACAIVMDVNTGDILAMVSLPDYDANNFRHAAEDERFNRAVTGMYEPGSTFKLQTAAMGLQLGVIHIWDRFSTIPIHIGRFTIRDLKSDHFAPYLALPEVMAYSSNPAAAHIAMDVGAKRQQEWLKQLGFFNRVPVELPEVGRPIVPSIRNWGISTVMTVGFGHGIAEPPLAIVRGTAATVNGGILIKPTLIARSTDGVSTVASLNPSASSTDAIDPRNGERVISEEISLILRKILRSDVLYGTGKKAESVGYYVGGKSGTAEKVGKRGGYLKHVNISAFTSVFPMNKPRYTVYVMLDSPKPTPQTHGWTTAGWNAAPTASKIISRIGPMLGLFPDTKHTAQIEAELSIPLKPAVPRGVRPLGPGNDPGDPRNAKKDTKTEKLKKKKNKTQTVNASDNDE